MLLSMILVRDILCNYIPSCMSLLESEQSPCFISSLDTDPRCEKNDFTLIIYNERIYFIKSFFFIYSGTNKTLKSCYNFTYYF